MKSLKHQLSSFMMFSAVFVLVISGAQTAMANPGVGTNDSPNPAPVGGEVTIGIKDSGDGPYDNLKIAVYEPGLTAGQVLPNDSPDGSACTLANPIAGKRSWQLMYGTINGAASNALFDLPNNPDQSAQVKIKFGLGAATTLTPSYLGSPNAALQDPTQAAGSGVFFWRQINSAGATVADDNDIIDILTGSPTPGIYRYAVCGGETNDVGQLVDTNALDFFATQAVVGGSIIPINTVSLVVAGMLSSPLLMLPTIGALVVTGLSIYKFSKKQ